MDRQIGPARRRLSPVLMVIIVLLGVGLGLGIYYSPQYLAKEEPPPTFARLAVGGTSAVFVLVENRWKKEYRDKKGIELSYESTGSTAGAKHLVDGSYAIVFTHAPLSAEQREEARKKGGEVVHIPIVLCGVAPVYNVKELKGKPPLKLTGEVLANVFLGKITKWNDPAIAAVNPGLELPPTNITVVHREDSSGTTQLFTEYLAAVSPIWREQVGPPASVVKWPVGTAAARNLGVASLVDKTEGAIGYVDRIFTTYDEMKLDYAAIQTRDKSGFICAEPENMTAAAAGIAATIPDDLTFDLANKPGKDAYPISGVIYAVCYQSMPAAMQQRVVEFLRFATHEGQPGAANMTFAPLPPELLARVEQRLDTIKSAP